MMSNIFSTLRYNKYHRKRALNIGRLRSKQNFLSQWQFDGLVIITNSTFPYKIEMIRNLWVRQLRDRSEYLIGNDLFVFINWPLNHKRQLSKTRDAQRVSFQTLRDNDPEKEWLYLADF